MWKMSILSIIIGIFLTVRNKKDYKYFCFYTMIAIVFIIADILIYILTAMDLHIMLTSIIIITTVILSMLLIYKKYYKIYFL